MWTTATSTPSPWHGNLPLGGYAVLSLDGTTVYVGSLDDNLYAVRAADGTEVWKFETTGHLRWGGRLQPVRRARG